MRVSLHIVSGMQKNGLFVTEIHPQQRKKSSFNHVMAIKAWWYLVSRTRYKQVREGS